MNTTQQPVDDLKSLTELINKHVKEGYTHNFRATENGLLCQETEELFQPEEVKIANFYRFEGMTNPEDNSILYIIETSNGLKGTLVDAYGAYSDAETNEFIKAVEDLNKKNTNVA